MDISFCIQQNTEWSSLGPTDRLLLSSASDSIGMAAWKGSRERDRFCSAPAVMAFPAFHAIIWLSLPASLLLSSVAKWYRCQGNPTMGKQLIERPPACLFNLLQRGKGTRMCTIALSHVLASFLFLWLKHTHTKPKAIWAGNRRVYFILHF